MNQYVLNYQYEGFLSSQMNMEMVCSILQGRQKTLETSRQVIYELGDDDKDNFREKFEIKIKEV